jgi:hypothetical protein
MDRRASAKPDPACSPREAPRSPTMTTSCESSPSSSPAGSITVSSACSSTSVELTATPKDRRVGNVRVRARRDRQRPSTSSRPSVNERPLPGPDHLHWRRIVAPRSRRVRRALQHRADPPRDREPTDPTETGEHLDRRAGHSNSATRRAAQLLRATRGVASDPGREARRSAPSTRDELRPDRPSWSRNACSGPESVPPIPSFD